MKPCIFILVALCVTFNCFSQATIVSTGFEGGDSWAGGGIGQTETGASDTPANQRILTGSASWQINNASETIDLASVNVSGYSEVIITLRVSATSKNPSNGIDPDDKFNVFVNINDNGFPTTPDVALTGHLLKNSRWGYNATRVLSTTAGTPVAVSSPQTGTNTFNYSTIEIKLPAGTSTVALRITASNNLTSEFWNVDDVSLKGFTSLPVELSYFRGSVEGKATLLTWQTASESNNDYFSIERSTDGHHFQEIGTVNGQGNNNSVHDYYYKDAAPSPGTNYYRLRQVDFDGQYEHSNIISVRIKNASPNAQLYPTVATHALQLNFEHPTEVKGTALVLDQAGRIVKTISLEPNLTVFPISIEDLPNGHYFMNVQQGAVLETLNFFKL